VFAKIDDLGFISTPYRKVENGRVDLTEDGVVFLTAEEEEGQIIAQATAPIDPDGNLINQRVKTRLGGDYRS
jgi:DNA-directed RNA polymerase subunit beta